MMTMMMMEALTKLPHCKSDLYYDITLIGMVAGAIAIKEEDSTQIPR